MTSESSPSTSQPIQRAPILTAAVLALLLPTQAAAQCERSIAAGARFSLAALEDGTVRAWGENRSGQLGRGDTQDSVVPVTVSGLSGVVEVAAGAFHALARTSDNTVWAWGGNGYGQLGQGDFDDRSEPVQVSGLTNVVAIAAGHYHSLALDQTGAVWAWGYNEDGELGLGDTTDRSTPQQVSGLTGVAAIAAGGFPSLSRSSDGSVRAWGYNGEGELGLGDTANRKTPVELSLTGVQELTAGIYHSLARLSDGSARAWGWNRFGQLGDNSTTTRLTPVAVTGLTNVAEIAAGGYHSVARLSDGTLRAWGRNASGSLGDGTTDGSLVPIPVASLSGVAGVAGGGFHSVAMLQGDAALWSWGFNAFGQVGNGASANALSAVRTQIAPCAETPAGSDVAVEVTTDDAIPIALTFATVTTSGETSAVAAASCSSSSFQLCDPPACYDVTTTANTDGSVTICLTYTDLLADGCSGVPEENIVLLHDESDPLDGDVDDPEDVIGAAPDLDQDRICGTASSLSLLTLANRPPPIYDADIRPGSCPNNLNLRPDSGRPRLKVAISAKSESAANVHDLDEGSLFLEGVAPIRCWYEDESRYLEELGPCCSDEQTADGVADLICHFNAREVAAAVCAKHPDAGLHDEIGLFLAVTGTDGRRHQLGDCIRVVGRGCRE